MSDVWSNDAVPETTYVAYVVVEGDVSNALRYASHLSMFSYFAFEEWDLSFFEKNIEDFMKGEEVTYDAFTYRYYNVDEFSDLDV